jgi:glycosyltransferase involved in cell wall biosynthesis
MNILFIASSANIKVETGEAIHMRELAINLANLGHRVSLIAGYSSDSSDELYTLENHPHIELYYNKNIFKIPFPRSHDISGILTCLKAARENPPDVIYERNFTCKFGTLLSKLLRKPFVVEINGIVDEEAKLQGTYKNPKYTKSIRMKFRRYFFKSANKIVAVSPSIKEALQKRYPIPPDKIVVIPNGANTDLFTPMDQNTVKDELGLSLENKYVCFVGVLAPWQGVEYLVQAAPLVLKEVPEAMFLIVGDGMMRNELENMVKKLDLRDRFVFTGSVPFEHVPKYINASDVCVAPFIRDRKCSPIKVFEYLACRKPVIVSDIGADTELFVRFNFLIVVTPEDSIELANAVTKMLNDKNVQNYVCNDDRVFIIKEYSWKRTAEKVINTCESVIN